MNQKTNFYVIEAGECPECHGEGFKGSRIYCGVCGSDLNANDLMPWNEGPLSCGHDRAALREDEHECSECEGEGTIRREVPLEDVLRKLGFML